MHILECCLSKSLKFFKFKKLGQIFLTCDWGAHVQVWKHFVDSHYFKFNILLKLYDDRK